jgi:hypothetical protein
MEEWEWDQVKRYFRKILNSFVLGLLWMLCASTAGFYFKLAFIDASWRWYNTVFYVLLLLSFFWLLRYYYKTWKDLN